MRNRLTRMGAGREGYRRREEKRAVSSTASDESEARAVQKLLNLIRLGRIAVQKRE